MAYSDLTHLSAGHDSNEVPYDNAMCKLLKVNLFNPFEVLQKSIPINFIDE